MGMNMKHFICILYILFVCCSTIFSVEAINMNVGTVLFSESDLSKSCWTDEQMALLRSRMVFQNIVPQIDCVRDDHFAIALISYFRIAVDKVKALTEGRIQQIHLMALTDVLGGYLHHMVLPLAKNAFYLGSVNYESLEKLNEIYIELKTFLRTNGFGWAPPIKIHKKEQRDVNPLASNFENDSDEDPCENLIYTKGQDGSLSVEMPFLDSKQKPNSVALPFKRQPLRSLRSKSGAFGLVQYYTTVTKCFQSQQAKNEDLDKFNAAFEKFINENVLTHLEDDALYPAFGSVYRVLESMKSNLSPNEKQKIITQLKEGTVTHRIEAAKSGSGVDSEIIIPGTAPNETGTEASTSAAMKMIPEDHSARVMLLALVCVILIWILTGVVFCCCRRRKMKKQKSEKAEKSASDAAETQNAEPDAEKADEESKSPSDSSQKKKSWSASDDSQVKSSGGKKSNYTHVNVLHGFTSNLHSSVSKKNSVQGLSSRKSAMSDKRAQNYFSGRNISSTTTVNTAEKPVVFGYDFETTSSSESSTKDESSEVSSGRNTPR